MKLIEWYLGSSPSGPDGPWPQNRAFVPNVLIQNQRSPVPLANFQMAPIFSFIISSRSKKRESRYECLSEARVSHAHKTSTQVSSSVPHFLQVGLLLNYITYRSPKGVMSSQKTNDNPGKWRSLVSTKPRTLYPPLTIGQEIPWFQNVQESEISSTYWETKSRPL